MRRSPGAQTRAARQSGWLRAAVLLCVVGAGGACHRLVNDVVAPMPPPADWHYCWWTVIRSTLPADTVAAHFRRAFVTVGLRGVRWLRSSDTIWVRAGPAPVLPTELPFDTVTHGATYWSRVAVFQAGDSAHFRLYTAIVPPPGGWPPRTDSSGGPVQHEFAACEAIARAAEVRWIRRPGDPGGEERLPVWARVP